MSTTISSFLQGRFQELQGIQTEITQYEQSPKNDPSQLAHLLARCQALQSALSQKGVYDAVVAHDSNPIPAPVKPTYTHIQQQCTASITRIQQLIQRTQAPQLAFPSPSSAPMMPLAQRTVHHLSATSRYPLPTVDPKEAHLQYIDGIWRETVSYLRRGAYPVDTGSGLFIDQTLDTSFSVQNTQPFLEPKDKVVCNDPRCRQRIIVEDRDCLEVARYLCTTEGFDPQHIALLNMANDRRPGGGIRDRRDAQEEDLFRRTGLTDALSPPSQDGKQTRTLYPISTELGSAAVIYSPAVPVFRASKHRGYECLDRPFPINVISTAAIKNPLLDKGRLSGRELDLTERKIYTMLAAAYAHGNRAVILSAFGCGAFNNPPAHMAEIFRNVIDAYFRNAFDLIIFSVINDHNAKGEGNFLPFAREFAQHPQGSVYDAQHMQMQPQALGIKSKNPSGATPAASAPPSRASKPAVIFLNDSTDPTTDFLGGHYPCTIKFDGVVFSCAEAAFQAGRNPAKMKEFVGLDGTQTLAKKQTIKATSDWAKRKEDRMKNVLNAKFTQNPSLQVRLVATGNACLVMQGNDGFWDIGQDGQGDNKLGILLMKFREKFGGTGVVTIPKPSASAAALDDDVEISEVPQVTTPSMELARLAANHGFVPFSNVDGDTRTAFLGSYFPCNIRYDDLIFHCAEAVFQAGRDISKKGEFTSLDGAQAAAHGKGVKVTPGWFQRNVDRMKNVLKAKFKQNPELKDLLLATGSACLIMQGTDNFWDIGQDNKGANTLGILLMELRATMGGTGVVAAPPAFYAFTGHSAPEEAEEAAPIVDTAHTRQVHLLKQIARDHHFIAFYKHKSDPKTACFGNFHKSPITLDGHTYICAEAAFQAGKDPKQAKKFTKLDGDKARQLAKTITADANWVKHRFNVAHMQRVLEAKFQDPQLHELLLATGDAYLVEHCPPGRDAFWADNGDGSGANELGIALMELRERLGGIGVVRPPQDMYPKIANLRIGKVVD
ncbi:MAG: TIGR02452 family protein [Simkania sp.]|nr:TIGR02452 family protein [Simkania sp.]